MSNIETQEDFNMYTCDFEEFKKWVLSQHIIPNDSVFEEMKYEILDTIIDYEKRRDEHDRSGKFNDLFLTAREEELYLRLEIDSEFEKWVESYKLEKELEEKELAEKV